MQQFDGSNQTKLLCDLAHRRTELAHLNRARDLALRLNFEIEALVGMGCEGLLVNET